MNKKRHGFGLGSIMIVFVVAVAFYLAWNNYQAESGVTQSSTISEQNTLTQSNIETVKRLSIPALTHATKDASITVALSGGTLAEETVWFCDGVKNPPNIELILNSMSNVTLNNFNKYLDDSTDIKDTLDTDVMPYSCSAIYPEKPDVCPRDNYPGECDTWNATATGGYIYESDTEEAHRHTQDISSTAYEDRFFWMYYRLLEAESETPFLAQVREVYESSLTCAPDDPDCCITSGDLKAAFDRVQSSNPAYRTYFDEYVECTEEIECAELRSISVKLTCTDKKYKIPADDETGEKYLTWVVKEMITVGCQYEQCVIVGGSAGGGSQGLPAVSMEGMTSNSESDDTISFQTANYCTETMKCFDIDRCAHEQDTKLCFTP